MKPKFIITMLFIACLVITPVFAQSISIPGIGDVGFEKKGNSAYVVSIPKLGTYEFTGRFKTKKDFDLKVALPAGDFTDYIPGVGQILGLLGLDTVSLRLRPLGLGLGLTLDSGGLGALRGTVTESLSKIRVLKVAIDAIISGLEIRSIEVEGMIQKKAFSGKVSGEIAVIGKTFKFSAEGELSTKKILSGIVNKIVPAVKNFAVEKAKAVYNKAKQLTKSAGKKAKNLANKAIAGAKKVAHDVGASMKHGKHSFNKCYNTCVPNYANKQRESMKNGSNNTFQDFYNRVYKDIRRVEGESESQTKKLRGQLVKGEWNALVSHLDDKWKKMYHDDEVENFFFKSSSERKGRNKYKGFIQTSWDEHKKFRTNLYNKLMTISVPVRVKKSANQALRDLAQFAKTGTAVEILGKGEDIAWDLAGSVYKNGTNVNFYNRHGGVNQMWYLKSAGRNKYHIQSAASGLYIHISGRKDKKGTTLLSWGGAHKNSLQTVFTATADKDGMIRFKTAKGFAFDLAGGKYKSGADLRLWTRHNGDAQAFYVTPAVNQPLIRPGIYRIRSAVSKDLYLITDPKKKDGTNASVHRKNNHIGQTFIIGAGLNMNGKPAYWLYNRGSERYIHTSGAKYKKGTNLLGWSGVGEDNTRFFFERQRDNTFIIRSKGGTIFECSGQPHQIKSGSNVVLWDDLGQPDQRWILEVVEIF